MSALPNAGQYIAALCDIKTFTTPPLLSTLRAELLRVLACWTSARANLCSAGLVFSARSTSSTFGLGLSARPAKLVSSLT